MIGLQEAMSALQVLVGERIVSAHADTNHDGKIGIRDAVYALQVAAGLKD